MSSMKYIEYSMEELKLLECASVSVTEQSTKDVLFGFADLNAGDEMYGGYGGFSFRLYKNRLIIVQEYLFSNILAEERRYCVAHSCVNEIEQYYSENKDIIFPLYAPDNDSCDGSFSEFFFGNKWISALNIEYHDEENFICAYEAYQKTLKYRNEFCANVERKLRTNPDLRNDSNFKKAMKIADSFEKNQEDFDKTKRIMLAENEIMSVFFNVCNILKKYDIVLEQSGVTVKGESTTSYDEFMQKIIDKNKKINNA